MFFCQKAKTRSVCVFAACIIFASGQLYAQKQEVKKQSLDTFYHLADVWNTYAQKKDDESFNAYKKELTEVLHGFSSNKEFAAYTVSEILFYTFFSGDTRIVLTDVMPSVTADDLPAVTAAKQFFQFLKEDEAIARALQNRPAAVIAALPGTQPGYTGASSQSPQSETLPPAAVTTNLPGTQPAVYADAYARAEGLYLRLENATKNQSSEASFQLAKSAFIKMLNDTQLMYVIFNEPRYSIVLNSFLRTASSFTDGSTSKKIYEPLVYKKDGILFPRMIYTVLYKKLDAKDTQSQAESMYVLHEALCVLNERTAVYGIPAEQCLSDKASAVYVSILENPFNMTVCSEEQAQLLADEILYLNNAGPLYISRIHSMFKKEAAQYGENIKQ